MSLLLLGCGKYGSGFPPITFDTIGVMVMGQSELEYLFNPDAFYSTIPQPTPGNGNVVVIAQSGDNVAPVRTVVNPTTVAADQVNPVIATWSAWFAYIAPGKTFIIGDGCVAGTSRGSLFNADNLDGRVWTDFTSVANLVESEVGRIDVLVECWYNSDAGGINNFVNNFWPMYFGANGDGSTFTLGNNNIQGTNVTYCLWDKDAADNAKGRGIFRKDQTSWAILTPMPFCDGPSDPTPELQNFSNGVRLEQPARQVMIGVANNSLAQTVDCVVGPSAHLCNFNGGIHPETTSPEGQVLLGWPVAIAIARKAGVTINEPTITGISGPADGTYVDIEVDLPNGGNLSTYRIVAGLGPQSPTAPHQQTVTGFEHFKSGSVRPVFKTTETGYPASHRGTVTIVDTGSGSPRKGRVRITPEVPYVNGDSVAYLRGQASAMLQEPRDVDAKLYRDFLLEHIPSMYDASATYPFPGVAVRPYQDSLPVPVPPPAFSPRGVFFDGVASRVINSSMSTTAGQQGILSCWFRFFGVWDGSAGTGDAIIELRSLGGTIQFVVLQTHTGRLQFRYNQDGTGTDLFTVPTNTFLGDTWYHLLWAWDRPNQRYQIYANGVAVNVSAYTWGTSTTYDAITSGIGRFAIGGAGSPGGWWNGDIAHLFCDLNRTLDISVQENREKFALAGQPVNLGTNGELVFGTAPEFYFDGDGINFNNQGTAGLGSLNGTLVPSSPAPSY